MVRCLVGVRWLIRILVKGIIMILLVLVVLMVICRVL